MANKGRVTFLHGIYIVNDKDFKYVTRSGNLIRSTIPKKIKRFITYHTKDNDKREFTLCRDDKFITVSVVTPGDNFSREMGRAICLFRLDDAHAGKVSEYIKKVDNRIIILDRIWKLRNDNLKLLQKYQYEKEILKDNFEKEINLLDDKYNILVIENKKE